MARYAVNGLDVFVEEVNPQGTKTLVLLHGFTGSTKTWQHVVQALPTSVRCIMVDLIGHGETSAPENIEAYSMAFQVDMLHGLFQQLNVQKFALLGYSMGGRVALSYAVKHPQNMEHLLLESASPGLVQAEERAARKQADDQLAEIILQKGIESFVDKWENIPLFASQKLLTNEVQQEIRTERLLQRAIGLANSLRGMGTGVMPNLWDDLATLPIAVTLFTGELDEKFVALNQKMQNSLIHAKHLTIPEVGHAIHVENPLKFATIVEEMI
ncbi:2-succinyl-6-hydroxy-2,4-cyclohexadiene-1-carboxylate synthase [Solibacillus sp. MA9]|uniref:Putative 2-succinyl-6-hydroxy-2,4-cyclohexadiene-1-carboxylate synthase n=1 Tax=Solibacillus palustris TaxID=2908203 RepID=A0ABS9UDS8_9BACL|nr:2-succinyl-6-hydroxy-2,4-cyclohexadiene-1-carboxylate synthase [Solibacillus sp. MA9]MCH7322491.1 2-succinyl-6-hydroxy-2,4-cyclohexadiene-1-carboxylate synthase [Solibacillus sp. MA9]